MIEPLRVYQAEDYPFFLEHSKSLMLYEPRLGKTVLSCNVLANDPRTQVVLILCPTNAFDVWQDHIEEWFNYLQPGKLLDVRTVWQKGKGDTKNFRMKLWTERRLLNSITFYITTYQSFCFDYKSHPRLLPKFDTIICDEAHRRMKNRENQTVKVVKEFVKHAKCHRFHPLSGTLPSKGGPADVFALLAICNPQKFSSYWRFVNTFCEVWDNGFGKEIIGIKHEAKPLWRAVTQDYIRVRFREKCAPWMPKIQRSTLKVNISPEQYQIIEDLREESIHVKGETAIVVQNSLDLHLRIRQVLTCPRIFGPSFDLGSAFESFRERLLDNKDYDLDGENHVVLFTSFKDALPHFKAALEADGFHVNVLSGGVTPEERKVQIKEFQEHKGIMLCTIQYAEAFSLAGAVACYTIGFDPNPSANKQAEDRLVPQTGSNPIDSYYYLYRDILDDGNRVKAIDDIQMLINDTLNIEVQPEQS